MGKVILHHADHHLADLIYTALEEEGYAILSIASLQHIFLQINAFKPQIVLLDFSAAESAGICKAIKDAHPDVAIIALSNNHLIANEYSQYGFNGYITAPFQLQYLTSAIELFSLGSLAHAS
jgi:DNA-binding response OmpR family regulator